MNVSVTTLVWVRRLLLAALAVVFFGIVTAYIGGGVVAFVVVAAVSVGMYLLLTWRPTEDPAPDTPE
ncbi:hypothetical protein [Salinilacihabitans rarus]|uniref:hypothetical protein n=1 Tax=Salinilacihabitans rarus TaxID=2961596 RepID=UPI0020C85FB6|nr:hypothetical protein [Salinilacihabitans rarus]